MRIPGHFHSAAQKNERQELHYGSDSLLRQEPVPDPMPRITSLHWKVLECIFLKDAFVFDHQEGSHRRYVKEGIKRPLIIPVYKDVDMDIIRGLMRTARMSRERFFQLLAECK